MAFFNKIFSKSISSENKNRAGANSKSIKKTNPMRKLTVVVEEEKIDSDEKKKAPQKSEVGKRQMSAAGRDSVSRLKNLAENIRHRVHYIDKNDFAKKAVSSKDKVYDFDLRRDLAYFLANERLSAEDDFEIDEEKSKDYFQRFEMLVTDAAGDEKINYVVYGERTYVTGKDQYVGHQIKEPTKKIRNRQTQKEEGDMAEKFEQENFRKKTVEFPEELARVFRKKATVFVGNLKEESQQEVGDMITGEERAILIKIFTKRFLREMVAEKEKAAKKKLFQSKRSLEDFVGFVSDSLFE